MGALHFAVELRAARLDVNVADTLVLDMPMELCLELMTIVGAYLLDAEWKLLDDVIHEIDGARLSVALVNFQGAHPRGVVNRCVLVTLDLLTLFSSEDQELDIHLARHLLVVALGVHLSQSGPPRQAVQSMTLEGAIDSCVGDFDGVIALKVPDDPDRSEMIRSSKMKDLVFDLR